MSDDPNITILLRSDRDDKARAAALNEAYPHFSPERRAWCDRQLSKFRDEYCLGEQQAKALLCAVIIFYYMKVDEQDRWREHGEYVRAQYEWSRARRQERLALNLLKVSA